MAGAYYLKPNQPGRAAHIANAGYVVDRPFRGRGIGRRLVRGLDHRAPTVASTPSSSTWCSSRTRPAGCTRSSGWEQIGRVPDAVEGEAAIIYWRAV